jgi:hypothetical protein
MVFGRGQFIFYPREAAGHMRSNQVAIGEIFGFDREGFAVRRARQFMNAARRNAAIFLQITAVPGQLTAGPASSAFARALRQAGSDITGSEQIVEQSAQNASKQFNPSSQWRLFKIHRGSLSSMLTPVDSFTGLYPTVSASPSERPPRPAQSSKPLRDSVVSDV